MSKGIQIAIDGPAGAGKSTAARCVAQKLGYLYIDTGAMYRALTWEALKNDIDLEEGVHLRELLIQSDIDLGSKGSHTRVRWNGEDITDVIRTTEISNLVSAVAKHSGVREEMAERQRFLARKGKVVMDGRDIGTHVLPNAEVKIFLLASVKIRAKRRHLENLEKGISSDIHQIEEDISLRDLRDTERKIAPLVKADDAVEIDTSYLKIEEVVEAIMDIVIERIG